MNIIAALAFATPLLFGQLGGNDLGRLVLPKDANVQATSLLGEKYILPECILQTVIVGNSDEVTDTGNIGALLIQHIFGAITLTGAISVQLLTIGEADGTTVDAADAQIVALRMLPVYRRSADRWDTWSGNVNMGNVGSFVAGQDSWPNPLDANPPLNLYKLDFQANWRFRNIDSLTVYGAVKAENIYINQISDMTVTGYPFDPNRRGYTIPGGPDYSIQVPGYLAINTYVPANMGDDGFFFRRTAQVNVFMIRDGDLPLFAVNAGSFIGSIRVLNGDIGSIDVYGHMDTMGPTYRIAAPIDNILVQASGRIESIAAHDIGRDDSGYTAVQAFDLICINRSLITAQSIGSITSRNVRSQDVRDQGGIYCQVVSTDGNIDSVSAFNIDGNVTANGGLVLSVQKQRGIGTIGPQP